MNFRYQSVSALIPTQQSWAFTALMLMFLQCWIAGNVSYKPFGPGAGFTFGNGIAAAFSHDLNYRLTEISAGGVQNLSMTYNGINNITSIADSVDTKRSQSFTYDANSRLLTATGKYGVEAFAYDANSNRTSETTRQGTQVYSYPANSNRLASIAGVDWTRAFTYDAAGNTLTAAGGGQAQSFTYDARNRNSAFGTGAGNGQPSPNGSGSASKGSSATKYLYNAMGERAVKDDGKNGKTHFICDLSGNTIAEIDVSKGVWKDYIWLGGMPVAEADGANTYYIHADHLGQPQKMTDAAQKTVWDRTSDHFGETLSIAGSATLNLRFPGQYHDNESNLDYNFTRSYNAAIGGYIQSDFIGLAGGLNTYGYVGQNPVNRVDPTGEFLWLPALGAFGGYMLYSHTANAPGANDTQYARDDWGPLNNAIIVGSLGAASIAKKAGAAAATSGGRAASKAVGGECAAPMNPYGIPENYTPRLSKKGGGIKYVDPNNQHNSVRIMLGNRGSPNPAQQIPYVKDMRSGQAVDINGNLVNPSSEAAHIPLNEYWYKP